MGWMTADFEPARAGHRGTPRPVAVRRARALCAVREWVRRSPGTHLWLLALGVTSTVMSVVSPGTRSFILHLNSTNLVQLREHPLRALTVSALWLESPAALLVFVPLFELVHAPAERWLGTWRWLAAAAAAHVGATLVSQQAVLLGIRYEWLPESLTDTVDIGVSYGLAGVVGVLTYLVPRRWRWAYLTAALAGFGGALAYGRTFTDLGHFTSLLLGLACYGLTLGRPAPGRRRQQSAPDGTPTAGTRPSPPASR